MMMLKRVLFFLPLICLVVSHPQGPILTDKHPAETPLTPADQCDYYSCNGHTVELHQGGQKVELGQCLTPVGGNEEAFFCYVNADSSCKKIATEHGFISVQPCNDPLAPVVRNFDWNGLWDWMKSAIDDLFGFLVEEDILTESNEETTKTPK